MGDACFVVRRAERGGDAAFLTKLFASTTGGIFADLDHSLRDLLLVQQFAGQNASYRFAHPDGHFDLIEIDRAPVGRVITDHRGGAFTLVDIALLPLCRGRGIGTQVIIALQDEAQAAGVPLQLSVLQSNAAARRLYERLGFVVAGVTETHLHMQWTP